MHFAIIRKNANEKSVNKKPANQQNIMPTRS